MPSFGFLRKTKVHPHTENTPGDPVKPPEAGEPGKKSLFKRLFGRSKKEENVSPQKKPKESKILRCLRWMSCCWSADTVSAFSTTSEKQQERQSSIIPDQDQEETRERVEKRVDTPEEFLLPGVPQYDLWIQQVITEALIREEVKRRRKTDQSRDRVKESRPTVAPCGFPNIMQTCYMNSSLQSLLTLKDFVRDVGLQEEVWSSVPEAQLIRLFMAIREAHPSTDALGKKKLLCSFKKVVSIQEPEFRDHQQKDAHEFLTSVLDQIRHLSPRLKHRATTRGLDYSCPVEKNLVFKMVNTRTCKSCGVQSRRREEFTNLSVDLTSEGTVEQMIQDYQRESELEFRCFCGGNVSRMRTEFETLPRVLLLHLKRFSYSADGQLMKLEAPVELLRDLVLSSQKDAACYSLVSVISHYGDGDQGHYICDGVDPDDDPNEPTDHWLTFNDHQVTGTTGRSVCDQRQGSAYILFYTRHD